MVEKTETPTVKKVDTTPKKKSTRGIMIACLDQPYYGNYAFQLALSIKFAAPTMPISLLCNDAGKGHLTADKLAFFDKIIKVNNVAVTSKGRPATLKFKTYLYDVSPYDETIFFDADTLFLPKKSVNDLFDSIPKDCNFTMQNRGCINLKTATPEQLNSRFIIWANSKHIKEAYKFKEGLLYNLSSELIYFKKDKDVKKIFDDAKKEYDNIKVNYENFNGGVPDELPFAISMIKNNTYPHQNNWRPFYWEAFDKARMLHTNKAKDLYSLYYGASFGGNFQENFIKKFYQNLVRYYCNHFGVAHVFELKDKRSFLQNRHTI